jgi:hypothetical protein
MNTIRTGEHSAVGLSTGLDNPATGQAFLVGPSKLRPVDHCFTITTATCTIDQSQEPLPRNHLFP